MNQHRQVPEDVSSAGGLGEGRGMRDEGGGKKTDVDRRTRRQSRLRAVNGADRSDQSDQSDQSPG